MADLIGDGDSAKKEKMANAKILDAHLAKNKVFFLEYKAHKKTMGV